MVQLPLETEARKNILDCNRQWALDDTRWPKFDESLVEFSCLGGNHLLTFLKMVRQSTRCQSFISTQLKNGDDDSAHMSLSLLQQCDATFADAASAKVPCIVLRRAVRDAPGALHTIQKSENQGHTLTTVESDKQCCLRIGKATLSLTYQRQHIIPVLCNDFPHLKDHVEHYCAFIESIGGGGSVHYTHWKNCDARFTSNKCHLRGSFLQKVSALPAELPRIKVAIALAARTLPNGFLRNSASPPVQDWFVASDIAKIDVAQLQIPDGCIGAIRCSTAEKDIVYMSPQNRMLFIARGEMRVARLLCGKKHTGIPQFESFEDILEEHKLELSEFLQSGRVKPRSSAEKLEAGKLAKVLIRDLLHKTLPSLVRS